MSTPDKQPTPPDGHDGGLPSDWRKPTADRFRSRAWNSADHHLFTPETFGAGYGVNFYWLVHPLRYLRARFPRSR